MMTSAQRRAAGRRLRDAIFDREVRAFYGPNPDEPIPLAIPDEQLLRAADLIDLEWKINPNASVADRVEMLRTNMPDVTDRAYARRLVVLVAGGAAEALRERGGK